MIKAIKNLNGNAKSFAEYCVEHFDLEQLVAKVRLGIDHDDCCKFSISEEQWQNAMLAAIYQCSRSDS